MPTSYSDSVEKAQQLQAKPSITFLSPIDDQKVMFGSTIIKLAPKEYSFLLSLVIAKKQKIDYSLFNQKAFELYLSVYQLLKGNSERLENRVKYIKSETEFSEETKKIYSESCTLLGKRIRNAFSIGKNDTPYIPSSSQQQYELLIELDDLDTELIADEIKSIL